MKALFRNTEHQSAIHIPADFPFSLTKRAHRSESGDCRYFQIAHQRENIVNIFVVGSSDDKPVRIQPNLLCFHFFHFYTVFMITAQKYGEDVSFIGTGHKNRI